MSTIEVLSTHLSLWDSFHRLSDRDDGVKWGGRRRFLLFCAWSCTSPDANQAPYLPSIYSTVSSIPPLSGVLLVFTIPDLLSSSFSLISGYLSRGTNTALWLDNGSAGSDQPGQPVILTSVATSPTAHTHTHIVFCYCGMCCFVCGSCLISVVSYWFIKRLSIGSLDWSSYLNIGLSGLTSNPLSELAAKEKPTVPSWSFDTKSALLMSN